MLFASVLSENFLHFLAAIDSLQLRDRDGKIVDQQSLSDHELAFSIYFCDPWQNEIEITTYEYESVRATLASPRNQSSEKQCVEPKRP